MGKVAPRAAIVAVEEADTIVRPMLRMWMVMEANDSVALQIEVSGPQFGIEFWTEPPIDGVAVQQGLQRSLPTAGELSSTSY